MSWALRLLGLQSIAKFRDGDAAKVVTIVAVVVSFIAVIANACVFLIWMFDARDALASILRAIAAMPIQLCILLSMLSGLTLSFWYCVWRDER